MNPLPEDARIALEAAKARRFSYSVRVLSAPDSRPVVILGETHVKLQRAAELGRRVVAAFPLRGVEGFQRKRVALGRTLGVLIEAPRLVLRAITGGLVQGSTIVEARALQTGVTFPLESTSPIPRGLHVGSIYLALYFGTFFLAMFSQLLPGPLRDLRRALVPLAIFFNAHFLALPFAIALRRHSWSWMIHPFVAILTLRDPHLAQGTVDMLAQHPNEPCAVLVMGRAHGPGVQRILIEEHGFQTGTPLESPSR